MGLPGWGHLGVNLKICSINFFLHGADFLVSHLVLGL